MTKAKPKFTPDPRTWNEGQVAARLGRSVSWFSSNRAALEKAGFPKKDTLLGGWDADAIEFWYDQRSGLVADNDAESRMLDKLRAALSRARELLNP